MNWLAVASWGDTHKQVQKAGTIAWGTANTNLPQMAGRVINVALSLLGLVFLAQALLAGYKWMSAQGDSKQVEYAKTTIRNNVIGLLIVIAAFSLTRFVMTQLDTVQTGTPDPTTTVVP